jgi:hypothetical protein
MNRLRHREKQGKRKAFPVFSSLTFSVSLWPMVFKTLKNAPKQPKRLYGLLRFARNDDLEGIVRRRRFGWPPNGLLRRAARAMTTGSIGAQNSPPSEGGGGRRRRTGWLMGNPKHHASWAKPPTTPPFGHPSKGGEFVTQPPHRSSPIPPDRHCEERSNASNHSPLPLAGEGPGERALKIAGRTNLSDMKPSILRREAPERTTPSPGLRLPSPPLAGERGGRWDVPQDCHRCPKPCRCPEACQFPQSRHCSGCATRQTIRRPTDAPNQPNPHKKTINYRDAEAQRNPKTAFAFLCASMANGFQNSQKRAEATQTSVWIASLRSQ